MMKKQWGNGIHNGERFPDYIYTILILQQENVFLTPDISGVQRDIMSLLLPITACYSTHYIH